MKGKASIVSAVHHLRVAKEFFDDFVREHPASTGARLFKMYSDKLEFIKRDIICQPAFKNSPDITEGIKREWESDVLGIVELYHKISFVHPEAREALEEVIGHIINGESLKVEYLPGEKIAELNQTV